MYTVMISQYWGLKETLASFTNLLDAVNYIQQVKPRYKESNNDVVFTIEEQ